MSLMQILVASGSIPKTTTIETLVIAAGGTAGANGGGGGGAGGVVYTASYGITAGSTYTVVVGAANGGRIRWW
jgi:hypothetical protein